MGSFALATALLMLAPQAQTEPQPPVIVQFADVKLEPETGRGLPGCIAAKALHGDRDKEAFFSLVEFQTNCHSPLHTHQYDELIVFLEGEAEAEVEGLGAKRITAGAFIFAPAKKLHRVKCLSQKCRVFSHRKGPYELSVVKE